MWYHRFPEILERLYIQETEHEMGHAYFTELFQFLYHLAAIACYEMLFWAAYHLRPIFCYAYRSQIGQLDIMGIAPYFLALLPQSRYLVGVLLNWTRIEVVPIGIAS